jgi:hypothetical protein
MAEPGMFFRMDTLGVKTPNGFSSTRHGVLLPRWRTGIEKQKRVE